MSSEEKQIWSWFFKMRFKVEIYLIIAVVVFFGVLQFRYIGAPEMVDETMAACAVTVEGEVIPCEVNVKGKLAVHPFANGVDTFESDAGEGIFINGIPVVYDIHFFQEDGDYWYIKENDQPSYRAQYVVKRECEEFVFCMDVSLIFPERESEPCLIVAPAQNLEEARRILARIPKEELSETFSELVNQIMYT